MKFKIFKIFCLSFVLILLSAKLVLAGFGVTPPYLRNDKLSRGSSYVQEISIIRGDPDADQRAKIVIDVPGANDWISVEQGDDFLLPKGETQVKMNLIVNVPKRAKYEQYKGKIHLTAEPVGDIAEGVVSIVLGMQIDVVLDVVKLEIIEYNIRGIKTADLEESHDFWFFHIPGRIKMLLNTENVGNVKASPDKVVFDIYDFNKIELLETIENNNKISKVKPFETKEVLAEFDTELPAGSYKVDFRVYNKEKVIHQGEIVLSIMPYGDIEGGVPTWVWIVTVVLVGVGVFYGVKGRKIKRKKK